MIHKSMALGAIAALALSAQAQAQTYSAVAITGGGFTSPGINLAGYAFSVSTPIQVTSLGIYDDNGDGLQSSHGIGLWTSSSTLLSQATIAAGAGTLVDGFRYTSISPVVLQPGNYVVAATPGDPYWMFGTISTGSAITFIEARYAQSGSLVFPADSLQLIGVLGGNFQYTAVPEPSTWVMAGVFGVGAVVTVGVRRRQAAKA